MKNETRVVITGMGCITPNANNVDEFKSSIESGRSGIKHIPKLEELKFGCQVGGECSGYEKRLEDTFLESEIDAMSEGMKMSSLAALEAFSMAQLKPKAEDCDEVYEDTGAYIGTGIGGLDVFADWVYPNVEAKKVRRLGSSVVERIMCSGPSAKIAGLLGLGNHVSANSSACSTGTEAVIMGLDRIRSGQAKRMLVGGVEAAHPHIWAGFDAMRVLSRKFNDQPEQASRPMSASAAGFVPGSGAGVLVIEELETALARKAPIIAEITGGPIRFAARIAADSIGILRFLRRYSACSPITMASSTTIPSAMIRPNSEIILIDCPVANITPNVARNATGIPVATQKATRNGKKANSTSITRTRPPRPF